MRELLLINITGPDKPGLTSKITAILADAKIPVLDIGQAVIHNHLSLGMLVEVPKESASSPVLKDLLFCAHTLGIQITFTPVSDSEYDEWVKEQGKHRYLLSLLARKITAEQLERVSSIIAELNLNIDTINRLSGRIPLENIKAGTKACVEFSIRGRCGTKTASVSRCWPLPTVSALISRFRRTTFSGATAGLWSLIWTQRLSPLK